MRVPKRISPSALSKFEKDRDSYFLTYCAEPRPPRDEQSLPASVGSSFDAFVKGNLQHLVFGENTVEELFESQVEPHNRDFAYDAGKYVFSHYKTCGAYQDLVDLLEGADEEPQFEFDADVVIDDIHIAGKPDCRFVHRGGAHVILDWKVNGFCGKAGSSPSKGYALCRDGYGWAKPSRSHGKSHKLYTPEEHMGIVINKYFMEEVSIDWADQLSMYAWMMGEPIGSQEMILCIDQIVAKPKTSKGLEDGYPLLRIANHKSRVSEVYQHNLHNRLVSMWKALQVGHIFDELDYEDNVKHCNELNVRANSMVSDGSSEGDFFAMCARPQSFYKGR